MIVIDSDEGAEVRARLRRGPGEHEGPLLLLLIIITIIILLFIIIIRCIIVINVNIIMISLLLNSIMGHYPTVKHESTANITTYTPII